MDSKNEDKKVAVIGAGLAGLMVAKLLDKLGFQVHVFEKRCFTDTESTPNTAFGTSVSSIRRSINLALSYRGIMALTEAGILEPLLENAIRMPKRVIHSKDGNVQFQKYGISESETLWSVGRQTINDYLFECTNDPSSNVKVYIGYSLQKVDKNGTCIFNVLKTEESNIESTHTDSFDLVIGADGAYSAVRDNILRQSRISFSREYIRHGYKELSIPPVMDANCTPQYALADHEGLHIWPRGEFMLIALPNPDKSFTATLFAPYEGEYGFENIDTNNDDNILDYFKTHFPDVIPLMPNLIADFKGNPVGALVTVRTEQWLCGRVLLIGDAAHAIVPFYGQGMNAAFEDALLLYKSIQYCNGDLLAAASKFSKERIPSTNALAKLCIEHYEDMAKNTTSTLYLIMHRTESFLQMIFPETFKSLYRMIAFSNLPYHIAVKRAVEYNKWVSLLLLSNFVLCTGVSGLCLKYFWTFSFRRH